LYLSVPRDFASVLERYTEKGYRVLAVAHRKLDGMKYLKLQRVSRDELETGLTLVGLIVLENRLKPATTPVVNELKVAKVRVIMVTGDNIMTALSVAKECGMVASGEELYVVGAEVHGGESAVFSRFSVRTYLNSSSAVARFRSSCPFICI
jgi:cation-transporting ATPase 13A3/4/5